MTTIDLIGHKHVKFTDFPDGQTHVELLDVFPTEVVKVICRLRSSNDVMRLLQVSEVLDRLKCKKEILEIAYLTSARSDRPLPNESGSFDLKVTADLINSCMFWGVWIFDPHSYVSTELIKNSHALPNARLVDMYKVPQSVLIVPDKGAERKALKYFDWNKNITSVALCDKHRDERGRISLRVNDPEVCNGRPCVIIDDICDGGATFLAIADQIKPSHLTLVVTHGIFSKGRSVLLEKFDQIITTDSYQYQNPKKGVKVLRIYEPNVTH